MKDQEELASELCSIYFNTIDKAGIEKVVEGLKKGVDHDYHICVAARSIPYSVGPLMMPFRRRLIRR